MALAQHNGNTKPASLSANRPTSADKGGCSKCTSQAGQDVAAAGTCVEWTVCEKRSQISQHLAHPWFRKTRASLHVACLRAAARRCVRQDCCRSGDGTTGWGCAGGGGAVGAAAGTWTKPFRHARVSARFKAEMRQCLAPRWGSPTGAEVGSGSAEIGLPCPARAVAVGALDARGTAAAAFTSGTVHLPEQNRSSCSRSQAAVAGWSSLCWRSSEPGKGSGPQCSWGGSRTAACCWRSKGLFLPGLTFPWV